MTLTDHDRDILDQARRLGPALRSSTNDRDRLTGWVLSELIAIVAKLTLDDLEQRADTP